MVGSSSSILSLQYLLYMNSVFELMIILCARKWVKYAKSLFTGREDKLYAKWVVDQKEQIGTEIS